MHVRAIFCSCAMYVHVHACITYACISFLVSSRYLRLFMPRNSETKLLGNNAGTSVDFTARHLRTPSCGTSARKIVLVISARQAAEPSLGTSAPRRVFNLRQALKLQTFARIRPHQPSCGRNLCARLRSSPPCAFESNNKERFRVQEIVKLPDLR